MSRFCISALVVLVASTFNAGMASASDSTIGEVKSFNGTVRILAGDVISDVKTVGSKIMSNDRIQTEQGTVEIKFEDGADLVVEPFSIVGVTERIEKKGVFFKSKENSRRITANTGTAVFASGKGSEKKNYLQTPTAVCGLSGSKARWGNGFINQTEGTHEKKGDIKDGDPQANNVNSVQNDRVFQAFSRAAGNKGPLTMRDVAQARQELTQQMFKNPDSFVKNQNKAENMIALAEINLFDTRIAFAQANERVMDARFQKNRNMAKESESILKNEGKRMENAEQQLNAAKEAFVAGNDRSAFVLAQTARTSLNRIFEQMTRIMQIPVEGGATTVKLPVSIVPVTIDPNPVGTSYVAQ